MKTSSKSAVVLVLAFGMGSAAWVWAEEGISGSPGGPETESCMQRFGAKGHADRAMLMEKRLIELHADLKLTAEQEAGWNDWSGQVRRQIAEMKDKRPDFRAMQNLPAPDRMEKWLTFAKERQIKLEEGLAATKIFYASLSPDQRKTFDQTFDLLRPGGWKGRHHREN